MKIYTSSVSTNIIYFIFCFTSFGLLQKNLCSSDQIDSSFVDITDSMVNRIGMPTLIPHERDIDNDINLIRNAVIRKDYNKIIDILGSVTNMERIKLSKSYQSKYNDKVRTDIKFIQQLLDGLTTNVDIVNIKFLNDAFNNGDAKFVTQFLLDSTKESRHKFNTLYEKLFHKKFEDEVDNLKDSDLKFALHELLREHYGDDDGVCQLNMEEIFDQNSFTAKNKQHISKFLLLCNAADILKDLSKFKHKYGDNFLSQMMSKLSNDHSYFIYNLIQIIMNRHAAFAYWVNDWINVKNKLSIKMIGRVTAFLATHAEVDLVQIKNYYELILNDKPIEKAVYEIWSDYIANVILKLLKVQK